MEDNEGFTEITHAAHTERYCGGCKFHTRRMIHSGRNPLYYYYCGHPDNGMYRNETYGSYIGADDITPNWCPYLKDK